MMDLLSPLALVLLALVPVLVVIRIWMSRRRRAGVRYSISYVIFE